MFNDIMLGMETKKQRITLLCATCGASREVYRSQVYGKTPRYKIKDGIYRCRMCWNALRSGVPFHPNTGKRITLICGYCGKESTMRPGEAAQLSKPYHCRRCVAKVKVAKIPGINQQKTRTVVRCAECGAEREMSLRAAAKNALCPKCSHSGPRQAEWHKRPYVPLPEFAEVACPVCGKRRRLARQTIRLASYKGPGRYVRRCSSCSRLGDENPNWRGGGSFEPYPIEWTSAFRENIRERDGHTCQICDGRHTSRRMPVHHIDYNKKNIDPMNLVTLCGKCHARTNFKRDRWRVVLAERMAERFSVRTV